MVGKKLKNYIEKGECQTSALSHIIYCFQLSFGGISRTQSSSLTAYTRSRPMVKIFDTPGHILDCHLDPSPSHHLFQRKLYSEGGILHRNVLLASVVVVDGDFVEQLGHLVETEWHMGGLFFILTDRSSNEDR